MTEKAVPLKVPFQVADAEGISFHFDGSDVLLEFTDWHENKITVKFHEVIGLKWQEAESGPQERDDCVYEILNSEWLDLHRKHNLFNGQRHFKVCFNAAGFLEILSSELEYKQRFA